MWNFSAIKCREVVIKVIDSDAHFSVFFSNYDKLVIVVAKKATKSFTLKLYYKNLIFLQILFMPANIFMLFSYSISSFRLNKT